MKKELWKWSEQIRQLEEYFILRSYPSPEESLEKNPSLAQRAITLLDKIRKIYSLEYAFIHLQEGPLGGYCKPMPKAFCPENSHVIRVIEVYDKEYFEDFLRKNESTRI